MKKVLVAFALFVLSACSSKVHVRSDALQGEFGDVRIIIFSSTDCPIANALAPEIERIHIDLQSRGGELMLVHVWEGRKYKDASEHAREYNLTMSILIDANHDLVDKFHATVTPEAVVLRYDKNGNPEVVYQGLINNLFDSPGNRRDEATLHYVRDAIDAAFAGHSVTPNYRKPTGCVIEQMQ
jgi:hypothetical protein